MIAAIMLIAVAAPADGAIQPDDASIYAARAIAGDVDENDRGGMRVVSEGEMVTHAMDALRLRAAAKPEYEAWRKCVVIGGGALSNSPDGADLVARAAIVLCRGEELIARAAIYGGGLAEFNGPFIEQTHFEKFIANSRDEFREEAMAQAIRRRSERKLQLSD